MPQKGNECITLVYEINAKQIWIFNACSAFLLCFSWRTLNFVALSHTPGVVLCIQPKAFSLAFPSQGVAVPRRPGAHLSSRYQENDAGQGAPAARSDGQRRGKRQRPVGAQPVQPPHPEDQEELMMTDTGFSVSTYKDTGRLSSSTAAQPNSV